MKTDAATIGELTGDWPTPRESRRTPESVARRVFDESLEPGHKQLEHCPMDGAEKMETRA